MEKKLKVTKPTVVVSAFLAFLFLFTSMVVAVDTPVKLQVKQGAANNQNTATSSGKQARLHQVKLKVCKKKQAGLKKRSQNLVRRGQLTFTRFDRIVERVKQYYTNRLVPKGVTIENYDQMLANIEANKTAAKNALDKAEDAAGDFDCKSDDPKGQLQAFRQEMTNVIRALKNYKKSVIDFLVAVRTKAKNIKSPTATGSATPSATP